MPENKNSLSGGFSGHRRQRKTKKSVLIANQASWFIITLGGIGTIASVLLVCVFLLAQVLPLFWPPSLTEDKAPLKLQQKELAPIHLAINEYNTIGWFYEKSGHVVTFRLDNGEELQRLPLPGNQIPTAISFAIREGDVAFGYSDGSIRYGHIDFKTRFIEPKELPQDILNLKEGSSARYQDGMIEKTPEGQFRLQQLDMKLGEALSLEAGSSISLIDISMGTSGPVLAACTESGKLYISEVSSRKNLMTRKVIVTLSGGSIDLPKSATRPSSLLLSGLGDNAYLVWSDGRLLRYDTRNQQNIFLAESADLVEEKGESLSSLKFMLGKSSLVSGDSLGRVRVWFRIKPEHADTADGSVLALAHELWEGQKNVPVVALATSSRERLIAAAFSDGSARYYHVTSGRLLGEVFTPDHQALFPLCLSPKDDFLVGVSKNELHLWKAHAPHPETTFSSIFLPVWYEGYSKPQQVWQSSSGTDDFEPKYGLYPLVFGTLKATFYSMIFGGPLALLAAIYSSEMMPLRYKSRVKPTIEMMASLPSVVLGFLAALVVAPFVENLVCEMLLSFITIPFSLLLGAHLWQLLPRQVELRAGGIRIFAMALSLMIGFLLPLLLAPSVENLLYAGDIKQWLTGNIGTGTGGWIFLLLPSCAILAGFMSSRYLAPLVREKGRLWSAKKIALFQWLKFMLTSFCALLVALLISWILSEGLGWDPRGSFVDTYVQRNALIVGFIMGFAIIPIIYTISEDSLSTVPNHLRSASLGAGATPWQTAVRVIIPTAASGLFSAVMIGLGRAVGETMIVLMAAGNTPVMDWNIFNGFRTLSANIAVELPEAVVGSSHYRMLFLAALTLFIMTFILNTLAESVRQRFRKRAFRI